MESGGDQRQGLFLALESLAGTAAVLLDAKGNLEHGNRQACDLLDCADEGALKDRWKAVATLLALPAGTPGSNSSGNADIPLPAGTRTLSIELHALDARVGLGHFAILKERRALDRLERELMLASERRGWGHQCSTLMHDLKGILNSMQISLELLSSGDADLVDASPEESRKRRRVATIKEDLKRMDQALRAIPGASGDDDPPVTEFDARDVLREIFISLRQLVRRNNVELRLGHDQSALPVRGRRPWIKQALFNVAVHRINAMRAGGTLTVDAATSELGVVVNFRNDAPDMREGLIDDGRRVFGPGRAGERATDLQVAHAILESQGGAMQVAGGGVEGTVFVMRLPH